MMVPSLKDLLLGRGDKEDTDGSATVAADGIRNILILDGGVSTHLENQLLSSTTSLCHDRDSVSTTTTSSGCCSFEHRELWSSSLLLTEPGRQLIYRGHVDWLTSGSNIVSTVTYQCHYERSFWPAILLEQQPSASSAPIMDAMWNHGVSIARQAVADVSSSTSDRSAFVAASLGCFGAALANGAEYTGDYGDRTIDDLIQFHQRKLEQALLNQPDAVAFETIPSLLECQAITQLLMTRSGTILGNHDTADGAGRDVACWVSLACRNGDELNDGTAVQMALKLLFQVPSDRLQAVGFNCCDIQFLPRLVEHLLECVQATTGTGIGTDTTDDTRAMILYPNSGETWNAETASWMPGTGITGSLDFCNELWKCVDMVRTSYGRAVARGNADHHQQPMVLVLGGCCRTSPASIAALRQRVDEYLLGLKSEETQRKR